MLVLVDQIGLPILKEFKDGLKKVTNDRIEFD